MHLCSNDVFHLSTLQQSATQQPQSFTGGIVTGELELREHDGRAIEALRFAVERLGCELLLEAFTVVAPSIQENLLDPTVRALRRMDWGSHRRLASDCSVGSVWD